MLSARTLTGDRDAHAVAAALRHRLRWARAGLRFAPSHSLFDEDTTVLWPNERHGVHMAAELVFDASGLCAFAVHYGWGNDRDRTRVFELFRLRDTEGLIDAALASVFASGATALRVRADGEAAALLPPAERPCIADTWVHVARTTSDVQTATAEVSDAELATLGSLGAGDWLTHPSPIAPAVPVHTHDPSVGHTQLIQSAPHLRPWFYPAIRRVEEADIVVVGGGIAGLTAAHALAGRTCLVLERERRLGGTARVYDGPLGRLGVGAHYEHDPDPRFGRELLGLYESLGLTQRDAFGRYSFVDAEHYVDAERQQQYVHPDGSLRTNTWRLFETTEPGQRLREALLRYDGKLTLPSRLADEETRELQNITFGQWLEQNDCRGSDELMVGIDVMIRSDYGAGIHRVSAFAGIHYFVCRRYLFGGLPTFAPPEGLTYVVDRLLERTPCLTTRTGHMVRTIRSFSSHVELDVLDLDARRSYTVAARGVVYAAPKKQLKYLLPEAAPLFARNRYATWITVSCFHDFDRERDALCWVNYAYEPKREHMGFTWVNHGATDGPTVLGHYIAYEHGLPALMVSERQLIRDSLRHTTAVTGVDATRTLRHVVIEKLGHAMPKPLPGTLFLDPNAKRHSERVVYAGVDTGRLPLLAEALDSGLDAAQHLSAIR